MSTALRKESTITRFYQKHPSLRPTAEGSNTLFFNRELSLLEFHHRVLDEALNENNPLLERLKFLAIFSSNIDEFFMIRVSGLKERLEQDDVAPSPDGLTPSEQLAKIRKELLPMFRMSARC